MSSTSNVKTALVLSAALLMGSGARLAQAAEAEPLTLAMMDMMGMMGKMEGMGADKPMAPRMAMPPSMPSGSMQAPMPGSARGMENMPPRSRLPGFPGASHLYHVGATGFFLDHPEHITLSTEQQMALNRIKEKALLERSSSERRIDDAEQEIWLLTAADSPDAVKIEARVRSTEKLRADQRMAFIGSVGEAAKALTPEQRSALLGTKPPMGTPAPAAAQPAAMPRM